MKDESDNPDLGARLSYEVKRALWSSSAFESALTSFIPFILKLPPCRTGTEVDKLLETMASETFASLLRELSIGDAGGVLDFERRVNRFLPERHWLIHDSLRDCENEESTPDFGERLIRRLQLISLGGVGLQGILQRLVMAWMQVKPGITPQQVETFHKIQMRQRESEFVTLATLMLRKWPDLPPTPT